MPSTWKHQPQLPASINKICWGTKKKKKKKIFKDNLLSPWGTNTQKQGKAVRNWKEGVNFTPEISPLGSQQLPH